MVTFSNFLVALQTLVFQVRLDIALIVLAAMPLPQLSPEDAAQLVTSHLINRSRFRKSHLWKKKGKNQVNVTLSN